MRARNLQWPLAAVLVTAAFFLLDALWIPAKAQVAQWLLADAWQRTLAGERHARPWPWADTTPVGVLELPGLGIRQIVLSGGSGRNLAFGPAALTPLDQPDLVLAGHRDTHFRFLGALRRGDKLRLQTPHRLREFEVGQVDVVDSRSAELVLDEGAHRLTLVTCYPLDAPTAGGPLRLVVTATARGE